MKLWGHQKLKLFMTTKMNSNPLQMPKRNDLKLALSHCRLQFADFCLQVIWYLIWIWIWNQIWNWIWNRNLIKNCLATRSWKSSYQQWPYSRVMATPFLCPRVMTWHSPFLTVDSRLHGTYYSFNIINCRMQFDDLSLMFAGYSLLFAVSQLHESLQDEVCILPFLDISL